MLAPSVSQYGALILQACFVLKLAFLLLSSLHFHRWSIKSTLVACRKCYLQLCSWWKASNELNDLSEQELDAQRCKWTRIFWWVCLVASMYRLILRQLRMSGADLRTSDEHDLNVLWMATLSLLIPPFVNPRSQDVLYMFSVLSVDACYLIQALGPLDLDVKDVITFTFAGRFMYAVLAKRIGCAVVCILLHFLQALQVSRLQQDPCGTAISPPQLFFLFVTMFVGIVAVRRLMRENVLLRVSLQKRTVEMGAVSSLLTACYDAVVEVDHALNLTQDSSHLSSMLLHAPKVDGLAGKSLLDFFSEEDRSRISEQFQSSISSISESTERISAMVLNADMLDSDFNHVKVELFSAHFKNLANDRCFLVALREIQDLQQLEPVQVHDSSRVSSDTGLVVVYDLYTFDVYIVNSKMKQLCRSHLGKKTPDNVLDIASRDSQHSLRQQLQGLANQVPHQTSNDAMVAFDLLGLRQVRGSVTIEHDHTLDCWVATMVIYLNDQSSNLTWSNLQSLSDSFTGPSVGLEVNSVDSFRSRSSRRSSRASSYRSRSRRSRATTGDGNPSGAISQLHDDANGATQVRL